MKKIGLLAFFLTIVFQSYYIYGQTTYTWNGGASASWAVSTNWTPIRTTPATNDVMVFNVGGTVTATAVPTQTIGQLLVSASTIVNLQSAAAVILTIGGGAGVDLSVDATSQLNCNTTTGITITIATGATGSISGTMTFGGGVHKLISTDASGITFQSGSIFTQDLLCTGNVFGPSPGTTANGVIFASGSTFIQKTGSNPFALTAPASIVVFQTGSLFSNQQSGTPSFSGRTYANFEQDLASAPTITVTGASAVSIDNLTIKNGTFNFNMTGTASVIKGNISVLSGATLNFAPASAATVTLSGTSQTLTITGIFTISANSTIAISNHPVLVIFNGAGAQTAPTRFPYDNLTLSGGGLKTTAGISVLGILSMEGNATASDAPTYGGSATLQYKGASSQTTGPELAASLNNLIINNSLGVLLAGNTNVKGTFTLTSGLLTTDAAHLLTLGTSTTAATISGGSDLSFVNGPVAVNIPSSGGTFTAPVGKGTAYRPLSSTLSGLSGSGTLTVEQMETAPTGSLTASGVDRMSYVRYFHVVNTGLTSGTSNVTLSWGADDFVSDPTKITVVGRSEGGDWQYQSHASFTGNNTAGTVSSGTNSVGSITDGDFTLGDLTGGGNILNSPHVLTLTAFLEGYTNVGGTAMSSVNPLSVTVELHNATPSPYTLVESQTGVLNSSGGGTFTYTTALDATPYYIVVKSANTVETWSATGQSFSSGALSYNFSSAAAQAFGSNMIQKGSTWCIYSGDVVKDGNYIVDASDLAAIDNDNTNISSNPITDLNGDGVVDASDLAIADNNNTNIISRKAPVGAPLAKQIMLQKNNIK